jgi:hypothetical protein
MKKSLTQMTKAELLVLIQDKETIIADLNSKIDDLESMAVKSAAVPLDADTSRLLSNLSNRIKKLEDIGN